MQEPDQTGASSSKLVGQLFKDLPGTWLLSRKFQSADLTAPSGRCEGKASFTPTEPSPIVDAEGKLQLADAELLYHEQGEFEMTRPGSDETTNVPKFSFSRRYIWRLHEAKDAYNVSIWFTKPDTHTIDYLFHKIDIPATQEDELGSGPDLVLHGTGGHLCVDDFYSSSYSFTLAQTESDRVTLSTWKTVHEVRGPKKDQVIETSFTKA
jgi:hypothetical protein